MEERLVIGIDAYNQSVTGGVSKALTHIATDNDHIPLVLIVEKEDGRNSVYNRNDTEN